MMIYAFLYDSAFLNNTSAIDSVRKTGGIGVLSSTALSYFVTPQEFVDPRPHRASNLNLPFSTKAHLILDQAQYATVLSQIQSTWTLTEQENLFAIIDQLFFAYAVNASIPSVELSLAQWPQFLANSLVISTTNSTAPVYDTTPGATIICPDCVTFTFVTANSTQYEFQIWLNNTLFTTQYPLSTIAVVVPPVPLAELYTLNVTTSTDNILSTALVSSATNQQTLQSYIQSAQYSGYVAQTVLFYDANGNTAAVEFNLLYNGAAPGSIAIRTAIRNLIEAAIAGTSQIAPIGNLIGWQALLPSLFVTEVFYLLPMWDVTTSLVNSIIYPNITSIQQALTDAELALYDVSAGFITSNLSLLSVFYNDMTVLAIPDAGNNPNRFALLAEHPTYQNVATTNPAFATMTTETKQFAAFLGAALSYAAGNTNTNIALSTYTPPNDTRMYITFTVSDVVYYVMTKTVYLDLVNNT